MTPDRHPDRGTSDSQEPQSDWAGEAAPAGAASRSYDGEIAGEAGDTQFAKAPSTAAPDPEPPSAAPDPEPSGAAPDREPPTSFSSSFQSSTPPAYAASDPSRSSPNMLPGREGRRSVLERFVVRIIATGGVVGIGVAIAAILAANKVQGWIIGLVVAIVSVILSAVLWSSKQL
jgi:hypothetical protein